MRLMIVVISALSVGIVALACGPNHSGSDGTQCPTKTALLPGSNAYPHSELPSGPCGGGESCQLAVLDCDPGALGPVNVYTCTCASGAWSCRVTLGGSAYCGGPVDISGSPGFDAKDAAADSGKPKDGPPTQCSTEAAPLPGGSGAYPHSELPAGACWSGDESCELAVLDCDVPGALGPVNKYKCTCVSGTWKCDLALHGSSLCPSDQGSDASASDAGTDAGKDAGKTN